MSTINIVGTGGIIEGNLGAANVNVNLDAVHNLDGSDDSSDDGSDDGNDDGDDSAAMQDDDSGAISDNDEDSSMHVVSDDQHFDDDASRGRVHTGDIDGGREGCDRETRPVADRLAGVELDTGTDIGVAAE